MLVVVWEDHQFDVEMTVSVSGLLIPIASTEMKDSRLACNF